MTITPAILTDSLQTLQSEVDRFLQLTPQPTAVQIDIIDGEFADNLTVEAGALHQVEFQKLAVDVHLITIEPGNVLPELKNLPNLRSVVAQVERMSSIPEFVAAAKEDLGCQVGLSLDLYTKIEDLEEELEEVQRDISLIQVMGNKAGVQGQELHATALQTLKEVLDYRRKHGLSWEVSVDIGMNAQTIPQVAQLGATEAVVGSYLQGAAAQKHWQQLQ